MAIASPQASRGPDCSIGSSLQARTDPPGWSTFDLGFFERLVTPVAERAFVDGLRALAYEAIGRKSQSRQELQGPQLQGLYAEAPAFAEMAARAPMRARQLPSGLALRVASKRSASALVSCIRASKSSGGLPLSSMFLKVA